MTDKRKLLDDQLSGVTWTQANRSAVLCAIRKENQPMKKKTVMMLAIAAVMVLMTTLAVAVGTTWGVLDFAARSSFVRDQLPQATVRPEIVQTGGECPLARFSVTDAVYDDNTVCLTILAEPAAPDTLLMDFSLPLDAPASNLDKALPRTVTIRDWCEENGFPDRLGIDISPRTDGRWLSSGFSWHLEENGACTTLVIFDNVAAGDRLDVEFLCTVWGEDTETGDLSDLDNTANAWLTCTLQIPAE